MSWAQATVGRLPRDSARPPGHDCRPLLPLQCGPRHNCRASGRGTLPSVRGPDPANLPSYPDPVPLGLLEGYRDCAAPVTERCSPKVPTALSAIDTVAKRGLTCQSAQPGLHHHGCPWPTVPHPRPRLAFAAHPRGPPVLTPAARKKIWPTRFSADWFGRKTKCRHPLSALAGVRGDRAPDYS